MAIHDWTRVFPGTFHDFHCSWITHLKESLNEGLLPPDYYALAEQHSGDVVPDVLTLSRRTSHEREGSSEGGVLLAEASPRVSLRMVADEDTTYRTLRRTIAIRHRSSREIVAMIEIVSPANKSRKIAFEQFVDKSVSAIRQGIHLLVIDLLPPTPRYLHGIHGAIWSIIGGDLELPAGRPLTLVAYRADRLPEAYVEPIAVGAALPAMSLFLDADRYVETPLASTYDAAYQGIPGMLRDVLEGRAPTEWETETESRDRP